MPPKKGMTAFEWYLYFLTIRENEGLNRKKTRIVMSLPFDLILILLLASYKTG